MAQFTIFLALCSLTAMVLAIPTAVPPTVDPDPDTDRTIAELIESRKFVSEQHFVTTEDGYILGVYRIVNPHVKQSQRKDLKPIILQHGLLGSGADFLMNAPGGDALPCTTTGDLPEFNVTTNNLGFLLANLCYDVWLPNSRGNSYSRNHTHLNPETDKKFWEFSFDEMISYDSPAVIEFVLKTTKKESLGYIGHSQGTLIMFGLLSIRPEYSLKVKPFIALAPVAFVGHISFALRLAAHIPGGLYALRQIGGKLDDSSPIWGGLEDITCAGMFPLLCNNLIYPLNGYNPKNLNQSRFSVYQSESHAGSSIWNLVHFGQNVVSGRFAKFDYGQAENIKRYGGPSPPDYPLTQINSTQMALFYSKSDDLGDLKDVKHLIETIKVPLMRDYFVPLPSWNHMDFIYGKQLYEYVHTVVLDVLRSTYVEENQVPKNVKGIWG